MQGERSALEILLGDVMSKCLESTKVLVSHVFVEWWPLCEGKDDPWGDGDRAAPCDGGDGSTAMPFLHTLLDTTLLLLLH